MIGKQLGKKLRYGSVCSGIEAASVAWEPLGWKPAFFAEIEKFPSQVLAHRYGSNMLGEKLSANGVPNYGDMTTFKEWPDHAIDLLVGGTPCQDFSIAGLRAGLDGERGNLTLVFASIVRKYRPRWLVWENVTGVLSSNRGRDFASILGLLSGQAITVPKNGWKNAGYIAGYKNAYGLAWRVLDAQYVRVDGLERAVPQRRRRVFLVGYIGGDWRQPTAVLFEREGLSGYPAPSRKPGTSVAALTATGVGTCGADDNQAQAGHLIATFDRQSSSEYSDNDIASTVSARDYKSPSDLIVKTSEPHVCTLGHSQSNGLGISQSQIADTLEATASANQAILTHSIVRRLTPVECERLMGFPDGYTKINDKTADGPRYKALGNSMAVNCMRWIGRRIELVERLLKAKIQ